VSGTLCRKNIDACTGNSIFAKKVGLGISLVLFSRVSKVMNFFLIAVVVLPG